MRPPRTRPPRRFIRGSNNLLLGSLIPRHAHGVNCAQRLKGMRRPRARRYGTLTRSCALGARWKVRMQRILCIEDDPDMIDLIRLILERRGFVVEGAEGGKAALQAMQSTPPDLVLLDLMMPDMDGWDVFQKMKADALTRNIPIIVVTASAQAIDREFGLHIAKVDDYIVKPFSPQDLLASVDRVLGNQPGGRQAG